MSRAQLALDGRDVLLSVEGFQLSAFDMAHDHAPEVVEEMPGQLGLAADDPEAEGFGETPSAVGH